MKITKDSKYFIIYLFCIIFASILTISVIFLMIFFAGNKNAIAAMIILPIFTIIGDMFAFNSFFGYIKTPETILEIKDDEVIFTPDKTKKLESLKIDEITSIDVVRPLICRSGKRIVLCTSQQKYRLEDIANVNEAYEMLKNAIKRA